MMKRAAAAPDDEAPVAKRPRPAGFPLQALPPELQDMVFEAVLLRGLPGASRLARSAWATWGMWRPRFEELPAKWRQVLWHLRAKSYVGWQRAVAAMTLLMAQPIRLVPRLTEPWHVACELVANGGALCLRRGDAQLVVRTWRRGGGGGGLVALVPPDDAVERFVRGTAAVAAALKTHRARARAATSSMGDGARAAFRADRAAYRVACDDIRSLHRRMKRVPLAGLSAAQLRTMHALAGALVPLLAEARARRERIDAYTLRYRAALDGESPGAASSPG